MFYLELHGSKMKYLANFALFSYIYKNWHHFKNILIGIILFVLVELIYSKWQMYLEVFSPSFSVALLCIYTFLQLIIIFWVMFGSNRKQKDKFYSGRINRDENMNLKIDNKFDALRDVDNFRSLN